MTMRAQLRMSLGLSECCGLGESVGCRMVYRQVSALLAEACGPVDVKKPAPLPTDRGTITPRARRLL